MEIIQKIEELSLQKIFSSFFMVVFLVCVVCLLVCLLELTPYEHLLSRYVMHICSL